MLLFLVLFLEQFNKALIQKVAREAVELQKNMTQHFLTVIKFIEN